MFGLFGGSSDDALSSEGYKHAVHVLRSEGFDSTTNLSSLNSGSVAEGLVSDLQRSSGWFSSFTSSTPPSNPMGLYSGVSGYSDSTYSDGNSGF